MKKILVISGEKNDKIKQNLMNATKQNLMNTTGFCLKMNAARFFLTGQFIPGYAVYETAKIIKNVQTNVEKVEISSMNQYINCLKQPWQTNVVYWEHPQKPNYLIPKKSYKDYLIREMMSEIMEFVSENMALEKIIVTLIKNKSARGGIGAKIEDINIGTKFSGYINTEYNYTLENVPKAKQSKGVPVWLKAFPNVVSAVRHGVGSMETTEKVDAGVTFGLSGADIAEASFGADKSMTFYIYFKKK